MGRILSKGRELYAVPKAVDGGVPLGREFHAGRAERTGEPVHAASAHLWRLEDERFVGVERTTASAAWRNALDPPRRLGLRFGRPVPRA